MSRVDAVRLAIEKAQEDQPAKLDGAAMASDAFFPFPDGPEAAIEPGVQRDHPARRVQAGPRGDRGLRSRGRRDGLHGPPALPALAPSLPLRLRARSSVAELRTFNPGVLGSNPSGPI